ncbi:hypothetical protein OS493_031137 [Desmophyllum pertusum]|uniref:Ig-like domain-containing protein n=1 Tax=Desmophyllum pertusum TaxID=174260 RepID=A0A9X0CET8_9CNID|nr:hypothetical protein OS493_031137 [Desmophyllum pertusum]
MQHMPKITRISADQALNKGDITSLNCTADGNPRPNITWTKVSDNSAVSFPLTITGKENEGQYRCTAQNGVGHTVSKVVSIIVHCECFYVEIVKLYLWVGLFRMISKLGDNIVRKGQNHCLTMTTGLHTSERLQLKDKKLKHEDAL